MYEYLTHIFFIEQQSKIQFEILNTTKRENIYYRGVQVYISNIDAPKKVKRKESQITI